MNTPTSKPTGKNRNIPVYLTPEQIQAQIPPGVHTTLNPLKMKLTQKDMDRINEVIHQFTDQHTKNTVKEQENKDEQH